MKPHGPKPSRSASSFDRDRVDPLPHIPEPSEEPDGDTDLDDFDIPCTDDDEARWEVFISDDDERDPLPDPGDFWGSVEPGAGNERPD